MKCLSVRNRRELGAIRLLDVAAIVCVVGVLAFLGVVWASRLRERSLRAKCQTNLEQIGKTLEAFSQEHDGLLPDCSRANPRFYGPAWPWDLHTNLVNELQAKGASREMLYCPANLEMNDDRHWNFWRYDNGPNRIVGYGMLLKGVQQVPRNLWRVSLRVPVAASPAQTELSFDATASAAEDFAAFTGLWKDRSSHMRGSRPLGGNVLFLDQHVEWRDFSQMQVRFSTVGPGTRVEWSY